VAALTRLLASQHRNHWRLQVRLKLLDLVVFAIYLAFLALGIVAAPRTTLSYIALSLSVSCAILWFVARRQLGDAFSVAPEARHLVTRGLYSRLRHPIYVFGTLAFLFVVLALQGWAALIIWAVVILIQVVRVRREERVLADTFGEEYTAYRRRTWF
jgi:protein-S-isoprenylcysteine O-methyltransferase Ste14